jgi:23S rRNA-intervening sequence protein
MSGATRKSEKLRRQNWVGMQKEENDLRNRTQHFALSIMRMFSMIPKSTEAQVLGKQMVRSGTSVGANYREAYRGRS